MSRLKKYLMILAAVLIICSGAAACAEEKPPAQQQQTGGTKTGRGIGGTGIQFVDGKGGIGGTGINRGGAIGVYGRITGFGSIFVNGLEIHYSKDTPVRIFGGAASAQQLHIGQVVSVVAESDGNRIVARNIDVDSVASGRLEKIDAVNNTIRISGSTVSVQDAAAIGKSFAMGDTVSVNGFRQADGHVLAGYVERTAEPAPVVKSPLEHFSGVQSVLVQSYVTEVGEGGKGIVVSGNMSVTGIHAGDVHVNDRIIVAADLEKDGALHVESVEVENARMPQVEHENVRTEETPRASEIKAPEIERSEQQAPEVHAPEIHAPEIQQGPEIQVPETQVPEIHVPEMSEH